MDILLKDLRYGVRSLLRQPSFTIVVVLTLGLGIGANTAIFSVINALILTPPSIAEPERVVAIWETTTEKQVEGYFSYLDLVDYNSRNRSFELIAGYKPNGFVLGRGADFGVHFGVRWPATALLQRYLIGESRATTFVRVRWVRCDKAAPGRRTPRRIEEPGSRR